MCGESAADDVTQEAFLAAWRALPDFRGDCHFSTWLYRLTTRPSATHFSQQLEKWAKEPEETNGFFTSLRAIHFIEL